jgi:hypothetical protein
LTPSGGAAEDPVDADRAPRCAHAQPDGQAVAEDTMPTLDPEEIAQLRPAETAAFSSPIPTQCVSSDEFMPLPQTGKQRQVEARIKDLGARLA